MKIVSFDYFIDSKKITNASLKDTALYTEADVLIINAVKVKEKYWKYSFPQSDGRMAMFSTSGSDEVIMTFEKRKGEIEEHLADGKLVIYFTDEYDSVLAERNHINQFAELDNYSLLPDKFKNIYSSFKGGNAKTLKPAIKDHPFIELFNTFSREFSSEVAANNIDAEGAKVFLENKNGKSAAVSLKYKSGKIVLMPSPENFDPKLFAEKLESSAMNMLGDLSAAEPPVWLKLHPAPGEKYLLQKLEEKQSEIEKLRREEKKLRDKLHNINDYKKIFYERGDNFIDAVINALQLAGLIVKKIKKEEGTYLYLKKAGEGTAAAVCIESEGIKVPPEKIDLLMNARDDEYDELDEYPSGLIILNHSRGKDPSERRSPINSRLKELLSGKKINLLDTIDLYIAVKEILESPEEDVKKEIRAALLKNSDPQIKFD